MTTQQKHDAYKFSMSLGDRLAQQRKEKKAKRVKPLKGFIEITTILAIIYVIGQYGSYEWDKISGFQAVAGCSIAVIYIAIVVFIHWLLDRQNDEN